MYFSYVLREKNTPRNFQNKGRKIKDIPFKLKITVYLCQKEPFADKKRKVKAVSVLIFTMENESLEIILLIEKEHFCIL